MHFRDKKGTVTKELRDRGMQLSVINNYWFYRAMYSVLFALNISYFYNEKELLHLLDI